MVGKVRRLQKLDGVVIVEGLRNLKVRLTAFSDL